MVKINCHLTAIMKTTERCNLSCLYCYEGKKSRTDMSTEVVEKSLEKIAEESLKRSEGEETIATIIWHGGEPLLIGISFYEKALEIQRKIKNVRFYNEIQSNLTKLNDDWIDFFIENGFDVGGSLDGPKVINDLSRITLSGNSSYEQVFDNIKRAKMKGLNIGVVSVIGQHNYTRTKELYDFFKTQEIDFEANPLTADGFGKDNSQKIAITPREYGNAMKQLFDFWFFDKEGYILHNTGFLRTMVAILSGSPSQCTHSGNCGERYFSISTNGDVYPCGRFGKETPEFKLGNIMTESLQEIMSSPPKQLILLRRPSQINECKRCDYQCICKAGCPYLAYLGSGDVQNKDHFCEAYKMIFSHVKLRVEDELKKTILPLTKCP